MSNQRGWLRAVAIGVVVVFTLSACSSAASPTPVPSAIPPTPSSGTSASLALSSPSAVALPTCAGLGNITLTMWSAETTDAQKTSLEVPTKAFEQKFPNVTVQISYKDFDTYLKTIKLSMSGDNPPDLADGNQGYDIDGTLVKAGLILNLDSYAQAFGWDKAFTAGTIQPNRLTPDGKQFGTGSLYGVSQASEYVAVFYNKTNLAKIGVTDPKTLDTKQPFEDALAKAKAAGLTPIMLGDSEQWPANHSYSQMQSWYVSAATSNDWVYGKTGATFDDQAHQAAAAELQAWAKQGYFNSDALAITYNDSIARFVKGDGVFYVGGDWATGDLYKGLGDNVGWMLYPAGPDGKHAAVGSVSLPIHISAKTKYPDCAAAYLDFITTSEVAKQSMLDAGRFPATGVPTGMTTSNALVNEQISEYDRLLADDGLMAWEDWATPTMLTLMGADNQELIGQRITPADYTKAIQANWDKYQASR